MLPLVTQRTAKLNEIVKAPITVDKLRLFLNQPIHLCKIETSLAQGNETILLYLKDAYLT